MEELNLYFKLLFSPLNNILTSAAIRNYWLFILCGMLILFINGIRKHQLKHDLAVFFSRNTWFSASAQIDYWVIFINPLIKILYFAPIFALLKSFLPWLKTSLDGQGILSWAPPSYILITLLTVTLFIVDDFLRWWTHYLTHKVPLLWEFHKAHHSAEVLNFATSERFHPVDILFVGIMKTISSISVSAVFFILWGDNLSIHQVFGANILWVIANIFGGPLRHSPVWLRFGDTIERWFISPAMHQIHHSSNPQHYDKNFGGALAIWDRWFGTLYIPKDNEEIIYGIGEETEKFRSLKYLYLNPFIIMYKKITSK